MSDTRIKIAAASIDITPQHRCPLAGSRAREGLYSRVSDSLELNAILLCQGEQTALILNADVLYVGNRIESRIREALQAAGIRNCGLLLTARHTHFAPTVDMTKPVLGDIDYTYMEWYLSRAVELVSGLVKARLTPVRISMAQGKASHSINRRLVRWRLDRGNILPRRSVKLQPNCSGPTDQRVTILRFDDDAGQPVAMLWNYACHPVCFHRKTEVSADYPGIVRVRLRSHFEPSTPVIFLQGFAGDVRPPAFAELGMQPRLWLRRVLSGPNFGQFTASQYEQWAGSLASKVLDVATSVDARILTPQLRHQVVERPLSDLLTGQVPNDSLSIVQVVLSEEVQIVAFSAEVVTEYGALLKRAFPRTETIPVGCAGAVFGYLPTNAMITEGGYEAERFFSSFSLKASFKADVEAAIMRALDLIARHQGVSS